MELKLDSEARNTRLREITNRLMTCIETKLQEEDGGGEVSLYTEDEDMVYVLLALQLLHQVRCNPAHRENEQIGVARQQLHLLVAEMAASR